jgi:hypothetical protein
MVNELIFRSMKNAIAVASMIIGSAEREVAWLVPAAMLAVGAPYNID